MNIRSIASKKFELNVYRALFRQWTAVLAARVRDPGQVRAGEAKSTVLEDNTDHF